MKKIVITGVGPLSSIGIGKNESWKNILERKTGVELEKVFIDDVLWDSFYLHKIKNFNFSKFKFDQQLLAELVAWKEGKQNIDLEYFLATIKMALDDSRLDCQRNQDVGLVLAHENPGMNSFFHELFQESYRLLSERKLSKVKYFKSIYNFGKKQAYDLQSFMMLYHVAKIFGIHRYSLFVNNACASGLYAIEVAADIIRSNKCKAVVVSCVDHPDIFKYLWFKEIHMYAQDGLIKPFCLDSNGFVFGEGGAALVIEDFEYAKARNAEIYAEYLAGDFFLEGWKVAFPAVATDYYQNLIKSVLKKCNLSISDIDLVNPHGVGNKIIDRYEALAINKVFKQNSQRPIVTALKPYFGHNLGGSAFLETVVSLITLKNGLIPPTLNCHNLDKKLDLNLALEAKKSTPEIILKVCSAFAGFDAAVIFKRL